MNEVPLCLQTRALLLLQESPAGHEVGAVPWDAVIWAHCPPQQNSTASVRDLCLDRYLNPWRDSAGKTYQQTRLLDAPCFPNNTFPQQKCWFKPFMLTWVQDKVMWFLEPPHQVMNDVVMKRKFHPHCPANKDRIVKPAVLSSSCCGHRFAEQPSTEDGDFWTSSHSHLSKISES